MAGVGPYGIEQVDLSGILGNAQNMQFNRVRMMMAQKQLEMLERTTNIQAGTMQALNAYANSLNSGSSGGAYGTSAGSNSSGAPSGASGSASSGSGASSGGGGSQSAPASSGTPVTSMPHASDVVQPPSAGDLSAAPAAPTTFAAPSGYQPPSTAARSALFNNLLALNPEMAGQVADGFKKMDDSQLQQVTYRNTRMAQMASGLLQLPQSQRMAALQQHFPELQQLGVNPQQFQNFQPTDANLRQIVAEGMDIQRIAEFSKPQVTEVRQGSTQRIVNPDQTSESTFESPTIVGPNGEVYLRSNVMPQQAPLTATNPKTGQRVQSLDGGKTWQPLGGQTPPASGNFQ